jgi:hypothetical protein
LYVVTSGQPFAPATVSRNAPLVVYTAPEGATKASQAEVSIPVERFTIPVAILTVNEIVLSPPSALGITSV